MKRLLIIIIIAITVFAGNTVLAKGTFTPTGDMKYNWNNHTAILLQNGKVLITGEYDDTSNNISEVYDSESDTSSSDDEYDEYIEEDDDTYDSEIDAPPSMNEYVADFFTVGELYDPKSNTWSTTGKMLTERHNYSAVLLQNGKVLAIGGSNNKPLNTAEIYDPITNTWSSAGTMSTVRVGFTSVSLQDGRLLVLGGYDSKNNDLTSAEVYDPRTNKWASTGNMSATRRGCSATLLPNGKVFVAGGYGHDNHSMEGYSNTSTEIYNPDSNTWAPAEEMECERVGHKAILMPDGMVYLIGGLSHSMNCLFNAIEIYDYTNNTYIPAPTVITDKTTKRRINFYGDDRLIWDFDSYSIIQLKDNRALILGDEIQIYNPEYDNNTKLSNMLDFTVKYKDALLKDGRVLLAGKKYGSDDTVETFILDPDTLKWTSQGGISGIEDDFSLTTLPNGKVLIVGGSYEKGVACVFEPNEASIAEVAGHVKLAGSMTDGRAYHSLTLLNDGKVLAVGGVTWGERYMAEVYDPETNTWTTADGTGLRKERPKSILLKNGKVLILAGYADYNQTPDKTADLYDPIINTLSSAGEMSTARINCSITLLLNGKVLVTGGYNGYDKDSIQLNSAEIYNPATNSWASAGNMNAARSNHTAILLPNGKVLVSGGTYSSELYDPESNTWTLMDNASTCVGNGILLQNGKVLIFTGTQSQLYDPISNKCTTPVKRNENGGSNFIVMLKDGRVLAIGDCSTSTEIYDPVSNTWKETGNVITERITDREYGMQFDYAIPLQDGGVLLTRGYNAFSMMPILQRYDPITDKWSPAGYIPLSTGYYHIAATLLQNGKVLITGGQGSDRLGNMEYKGTSYIYDPHPELSDASAQKVKNSIALYINKSRALAGKTQTVIDSSNESVCPFIKDDRTLVPVRFISEGFGAKVGWDDRTSTVTISLNGNTVEMVIGSNRIKVNGTAKTIDVPAQIVGDRTFVPLRALTEALGKNIFWDDRGLIIISDKEIILDAAKDKSVIEEIAGKLN